MQVYATHDVGLNLRRSREHFLYGVADLLESVFETREKRGSGSGVVREPDRAAPQCHEEFQVSCRDQVRALNSFIRTLHLIAEQAADNPGRAFAAQQCNRPGLSRQNLLAIECSNVIRTVSRALESAEDLFVRYFLVSH